jgi:hypothetical protein
MKSLIDDAAKGDTQAAHNVWLLIVLEIWLQAWRAELD